MPNGVKEVPRRVRRGERGRREPGDPLAIKRAMLMKMKRLTQADLVEHWKCSQPFVSEMMSGHQRSLEKECEFADMMGMSHAELWPAPTEHQLALAARRAQTETPGKALALLLTEERG